MSSGPPDEKKSSRVGIGGWMSNRGLIAKVSFAFFGTIFILIIIVGALNYGTITTDNGPDFDRVAPVEDIDNRPQQDGDDGPHPVPEYSPEQDGDDGPQMDDDEDTDISGRPEDLADGNGQFSLNAKKIAIELTKITPAEISQYPITQLSREEIVSVLELVNPRVLAKLLLNIPQEDLETIQYMLTPSEFNQTLSRLFEENRTQVYDRLS